VFVVFKELIFCTEFDIAKSTLRLLGARLEIDESFADFDAKVWRDALGDIDRNLGVPRPPCIGCDNA
jgi:hypothetical protein